MNEWKFSKLSDEYIVIRRRQVLGEGIYSSPYIWGEGVEGPTQLMHLVATGGNRVQVMRRIAKW